jgi:hypothetical protein
MEVEVIKRGFDRLVTGEAERGVARLQDLEFPKIQISTMKMTELADYYLQHAIISKSEYAGRTSALVRRRDQSGMRIRCVPYNGIIS